MADKPIIDSLLDVDFYKDTMGQMIFHKHPKVPVKFAFTNRHKHVRLAECIDLGKLRENLEHLRSLRFDRQELDYLACTLQYERPMFKPDYIEFLRTFRLPDFHLDVSDGQLVLEFAGEWAYVSRWETLGMQLVAELYAEYQTHNLRVSERDEPWAGGERRLREKLKIFKANPNIIFSDFGTRRRFSRVWQQRVIAILAEEFPAESGSGANKQFRGTSNISLALKHGLTPMGTNAHELPMVYSAIYRNEDESTQRLVSQLRVLEHWEEEYGLGLSIFLPDTYGSDYFFSEIVSMDMCRRWKGSRHDSGPPKQFGDGQIQMYESARIDPMEKLIIFADGLTAPLMDELERYFRGRIQTAFGIGTNLTNDLGLTPVSIVVKPVEADGLPVVKLSDNIEKATGHPEAIERMKQLVRYNVHFTEACRY